MLDISNQKTKFDVICPKYGEFYQDFYHHITRKQGCPYCKKSILENEIRDKLIALNIDFVQSFKDIWLNNLHLDFYLLEHNVAIECQGEQHYKIILLYAVFIKG